MNRDDIIRMAREAGFANVRGGLKDNGEFSDYWDCWPEQLERFANLVAAAERQRQQLTDEDISVLWHQSGEQPFKFARMLLK